MTFDEAVAWAYAISPTKDKGIVWGIYTEEQSDAAMLAAALLAKDPQINHVSDPLYHEFGNKGIYPHYHMPQSIGRTFNNKHKHFHIWYGKIGD